MSQAPSQVPPQETATGVAGSPQLSEGSAIREEAWAWLLTLRYVARERARLILQGFLIGLGFVILVYIFSTRVYEAKGVFVIGQNSLVLASENAEMANSREPLVNFLASIKTVDMARTIAEQMSVPEKNIAMSGDPMHKVDLDQARTAVIDFSSPASSRTAVVTVASHDPQFATDVALVLLKELEQFNHLAGRINQIDSEVKLSQSKLDTLNQSLSTITAHRIEVEQQIKLLDDHLKGGGDIAFAPPFADDAALIEMQRKETALQTSFDAQASISSRGPTLNTLRAATQSLQHQIQSYSNQLAVRLRANYSTNVGEETALEENLLGIQARLDTLSDERTQIAKSIGDSSLRHQLEESYKAKGLNEGSAIIVTDTPILPNKPARPSLGLHLVLGVLLGAAVGVGSALLAYFVDRRLRAPQQMEFRAGVPCLALLPESATSASATSAFIAQEAQPGLSFMRNLMMRAAFARKGENFFVFTRIGVPEDESMWVARLAVMLAKAQQRTLVVDLDFQNPKIAKILGIEPKKNLVQWFNDDDDLKNYVEFSVLQELAVLHPGKPSEPAEVLVSRRPLAQSLVEVGKDWDFVLIASPSIVEGYQLLIAAPPSAVMVGVVRYGAANFDDLATALNLCETYGLQFSGVVLHDYPRSLLSGPLASFSLGKHQYALLHEQAEVAKKNLPQQIAHKVGGFLTLFRKPKGA